MSMDTPICDFVREYASKNPLRFHMPAHKGERFIGAESLDITEISGADVLYSADGIIERSERNASALFGSAMTLYSTEGSSLSIRASLYLISLFAKSEGREPRILAARNAHKSFVSAAALSDICVEWIYGERGSVIDCFISPEALEERFSEDKDGFSALYITSPDYLGNIADVKGIAEVCHRHGALLLVDNAHGAYLNFLPVSKHPLSLGADICCDSAHKTLPVLTGGAYLHISKDAPSFLCENAERAMALFASTSPSYLILQSLDMANAYLCEEYKDRVENIAAEIERVKCSLAECGFSLVGNEPMKLTLAPKSYGYTGEQLAQYLEERNIFVEFFDKDNLVIMPSAQTSVEELSVFERAILSLTRLESISKMPPIPRKAKRAMSIREAMMSPSVSLPISECEGRVLADLSVSCPPAIPILVCGEVIDRDAIECFEYYGIKMCRVVK